MGEESLTMVWMRESSLASTNGTDTVRCRKRLTSASSVTGGRCRTKNIHPPTSRFHLRHLPEDARDFIIPMLTQALENEVILTVNLTNEEEELLAATDKLSGSARHYSFEVRRRLRTVEDDERQVSNDVEHMDNLTDEDSDTLTEGEARSLARVWIDNRILKPPVRLFANLFVDGRSCEELYR